MQVHLIDSRDGSWELYRPAYRVHLWKQKKAATEVPQEMVGWKLDEYELTDVESVTDAMEWAETKATEARDTNTFNAVVYTLYASVQRGGGDHGLVRVHGTNPTRNEYQPKP